MVAITSPVTEPDLAPQGLSSGASQHLEGRGWDPNSSIMATEKGAKSGEHLVSISYADRGSDLRILTPDGQLWRKQKRAFWGEVKYDQRHKRR